MKVPRLKLKNLMALDVADAGVLKCNVIRLLLKHPQGIKYGDFSGAFYQLHGHHPQVALHGYSSLKYLLTDMKNMVVLKKNSQTTVIKLASGVPFNQWLDEREGWGSSEEGWDDFEGWDSYEEEMQTSKNEEAKKEAVLAAAVVPILTILRDYPNGMELQTLTETLKKCGFDLEHFSQDMGHSDTIYCLLEMPGLYLLNDMVPYNCVVQTFSAHSSLHKPLSSRTLSTFLEHSIEAKPVSHSSTTSQATASLSRDLDHLASKSKIPNQNVLEKKPASTEDLALLTNLLKIYKSGLQEHFLTLKGFDLERFIIAQGYKNTVEFLEHQMAELKIEYRGKKGNCIVMQVPHSFMTSQATSSPSKTLDQNVLGKKPASTEALTLLTNFLKPHTSGLRIKKLQKHLLTSKGFDLEKFSIALGYKNTLEFLEQQMPELKIKYSGNEGNCVVMQASQSFMTSQATASPSCDLDRSKSKTLDQIVLGKRPASHRFMKSQSRASLPCCLLCSAIKPETVKQSELRQKAEEILALLTNLINTFELGVTIKKLQEFLLKMMRFDLEKFSITQGYRETLEFLEHRMPELKIKYDENRYNCLVKQGKDKRKEQKCQGSQEKMKKSQWKTRNRRSVKVLKRKQRKGQTSGLRKQNKQLKFWKPNTDLIICALEAYQKILEDKTWKKNFENCFKII